MIRRRHRRRPASSATSTIKYFLRFLAGARLDVFAWYAALRSGARRRLVWLWRCADAPWLRRSFIAGFFVTVPLVISVAAFVWMFRLIDGFVGPFYAALARASDVPGLGILTTALVVLLVGALATNVLGKRLLQRAEG